MSGPRRYESPESSPAIQTLLEEAEAAGFEREKIWEILWLITAHRDLIGFTVAAGRILAILERIQARNDGAWKEALDDSGIASWSEFLAWTANEGHVLAAAIEGIDRRFNSTGNNPVRGNGSTEFPFYAVLCEPLRMGDEANERFLLLSAHLLLAHVIALREHSTVEDYRRWGAEKDWTFLPNQVDPAARAVRRHAEKDRHRFLADLPLELPPEEFAEEFESLPEPDDALIRQDRLHLAHFLQKAFGRTDWRGAAGGGGRGGGKRWVGGGYENLNIIAWREPLGDRDDHFADLGGTDWLMPKVDSARRRNALVESDLDPDEDGAEEEILFSELSCEEARRDPGALARLARAKARHVAKRNQLLPWDYALLTDEEFTHLHAALQDETGRLLQLSRWEKAERPRAEAIVALMGMLLTASGIERIHRLKVCLPNALARDDEDILLVLSPEPGFTPYWRVPAHAPEYAQELDDVAPGLRRRVRSLPLSWRGGRVIDLCRRLIGERLAQQAVALFTIPPESLRKEAEVWLNARFPDRRVTLAKIEGYLWLRMAQLTGDPAHAACLFGNHGTLADVRLFYTTLEARRLLVCYKVLLKQQDQGHVETPPLADEAAVGARLCPRKETVRAAIDRIHADVMKTLHWRTRTGFIIHHNLFTLYVLQFLAYATAIRAIATPYVRLEEIDASRGLVFIDDKDDERKRKTRLAWIPERLIGQMQVYENHLSWVRAHLLERGAAPAQQPCFFLDESFQPIEARPKEIEKMLAPYLPVKANTHRRFLRTELLERGCPGEVIDALLGHWQVGEEPFGPYSSLSVEAYVKTLRRHLAPLIEEIGLSRVISIPLAE